MKTYVLTIDGIPIEVCQKAVKNLNLRIYPPNGEVRLSAPLTLNKEQICRFLNQKVKWIRRKQAEIRQQAQSQPTALQPFAEFEILGQKFIIRQGSRAGKPRFRKVDSELIEITVGKGSSKAAILRLVEEMEIEMLKAQIPPLIEKWQSLMEVQVKEWRLRRMKTRWGSCNVRAQRIWLNRELAKKPLECLEYVIVHEMTHLLERNHNARFYQWMDRFLPNWRALKAMLRK
ncbi:MAG: metal-dependent hydrolase [Anaerolineae bacterium]|jgi:predicted metal-dependent hydrolase|nr:MAG: metal-dependent hydrolase [Anaerolineae bacterium]